MYVCIYLSIYLSISNRISFYLFVACLFIERINWKAVRSNVNPPPPLQALCWFGTWGGKQKTKTSLSQEDSRESFLGVAKLEKDEGIYMQSLIQGFSSIPKTDFSKLGSFPTFEIGIQQTWKEDILNSAFLLKICFFL